MKLEEIIESQNPFTDSEFPPQLSSIYDKLDHSDDANTNLYDQIVWKRASEIFKDDLQIMPQQITSDQIFQGTIGDCYLISCLVSLSKHPELLRNLIKTKNINKAGVYAINLCVNGTWQDIIVDDWLPTIGGKLTFGHTSNSSIWLPLIEKAWAKLNGNYDRIINGTVDIAFIHLCGVPSENQKHQDTKKDNLWNLVQQAFKNNHIVLAGTGSNGSSIGLQNNHCYGVLSLYEFELNKKKTQLIKLQNPWGKTTWTGDWSRDSKIWTQEIKSKVGVLEDGIFCMSWDDFFTRFIFTNVCEINPNMQASYAFKKNPVPERNYYTFELTEKKSDLDILVNQMGDRLSKRKRKKGIQFDPSWFSITLCKIEEQKEGGICIPYKFIKSNVSTNYQVHLQVENLNTGQYILLVEALWNECAKKYIEFQQFCLKILSAQNINIQEFQEPKQFIQFTLASRSKLNLSKSGQILPYSTKKGAYKIVESDPSQSLYASITIFNDSQEQIKEEFIFDKLDNFTIQGQTAKNFIIQCDPQQIEVILLQRKNDKFSSFHFKSQIKTESNNNKINMMQLKTIQPNSIKTQVKTTQSNQVQVKTPNLQQTKNTGTTNSKIQSVKPSKLDINSSNEQIIQSIKQNKFIKRKQIDKKKLVFISELNQDNLAFFLFENEDQQDFTASFKFNLTGLQLEDPDIGDSTMWTITIPALDKLIRKIVPSAQSKKKSNNLLGSIIGEYEQMSNGYSYKQL